MLNDPLVCYVHGFNSSPQSHKAQALSREMDSRGLGGRYQAPSLTYSPLHNIKLLEELVRTENERGVVLIGSSMGGFYSAYLSQQYAIKAVLINPVVDACDLLRDKVGELKNDYTGEVYQMGQRDLDQYQRLFLEDIGDPEKLMLVVQTGDEVLDAQASVDKYQQCARIIQQGGSHGFDDFEKVIPEIFDFLAI